LAILVAVSDSSRRLVDMVFAPSESCLMAAGSSLPSAHAYTLQDSPDTVAVRTRPLPPIPVNAAVSAAAEAVGHSRLATTAALRSASPVFRLAEPARAMERTEVELQRLSSKSHELEQSVAACHEQMSASRLSLNGIRALQAAAQQEQYPLGRALQRWLSTRLVERLKTCPKSGLNTARGGVSQAESRARMTLTVDMVADRGALDELVMMRSLPYDVRATSSRGKANRTVQFLSAAHLLEALGMAPPLRKWCLARQFSHRDGSTPARVLVEWLCDNDGTVRYVLERLHTTGTVEIAVRASEVFDPLQHKLEHPLERKTAPSQMLPGLAPAGNSTLQLRPSGVSSMLDHEERFLCGRLTLSIPCCEVELASSEVVSVVAAADV